MTTIAYPDLTHKKSVPGKFNPNSYRIISENVSENENIPSWYAHSRPPPYYTEPDANQMPIQALETRNNPHAGRKVDMVYTNAANMNAPSGLVKTDNIEKEAAARWWDWSTPKTDTYGSGVKSQDEWSKKRESSYRNAFTSNSDAGSYGRKNSRYSATPQHVRTVGIVPITDLKPEDSESVYQTHVEKLSYEQQYDSRNAVNYPLRGKRQGAFVTEEMKPPSSKPMERNQFVTPTKVEQPASMWDLFHPHGDVRAQLPSHGMNYRRPLPQIKPAEKYEGVWQNAPYACDYQVDQALYQPAMIRHVNVD